MATAPLSFPDKEGAFDANITRSIFTQLLTESTESLESDSLEIKGWCNDEKELAEKVSDVSACLANASGGMLLIGISDAHGGRQQFSPCPYPNVTPRWLTARIHDLTFPSVECSAHDVSEVLSQVLRVAGRNVFAVCVPRKKIFGDHLTAKGISRIRVGKECRPHFTAEDDRSKAFVPDLTEQDLSSGSIEWGISQHERHFRTAKQHYSEPWEFLEQAKLIERYLPDEEQIPRLRVPLATLLLFGKQSALAHHIPHFETVLIIEGSTSHLKKNIVESVREICSPDSAAMSYLAPFVDTQVLKELLVNAYVHRCYRIPGPVMIRVSRSGLEIDSPGELPGSLQTNDLINCVPAYRNLLLSEGARFIGLCDKVGHGIDLVYRGVLSGGLPFPEFESEHSHFVARLRLEGSAEFREFLTKRSQALTQLEEIIVLRLLWAKDSATTFELSTAMQRSREVSLRVVEGMLTKLMIVRIDDTTDRFRLTEVLRHDIQTIFQSNQLSLDRSLWGS
jgi:ATP-dependent DNA helicase RecG